jgi:vacuolar protein sorting-associated protein IST1
MSVQRLQIAKNKKATSSKHNKREVASLLAKGKEEMARIKVEHIIREVSLFDFRFENFNSNN